MFPIVYLNENLRYCNENLAWGKAEPSFNPTQFGTQQKMSVELWVISFLEISCMFPLIVVDINELSYLCRSKRTVYRPCYRC